MQQTQRPPPPPHLTQVVPGQLFSKGVQTQELDSKEFFCRNPNCKHIKIVALETVVLFGKTYLRIQYTVS